jgi:hypothetical protein
MTRIVKIEGKDGLVRDISTSAIINTNRSEYQNYINRRDAAMTKQKQIEEHSEDINNIKTELSEIKQMLLVLINKSSQK